MNDDVLGPFKAQGRAANETEEDEEETAATGEIQPDDGDLGHGDDTPSGEACSIIGPGGAGKSFLVAGLHQACNLSGAEGHRLTFASRDEDNPIEKKRTSDLLSKLVRTIIRNDHTALRSTLETETYKFEIQCRTAFWRWSPEDLFSAGLRALRLNHGLIFELLDGPGGAMLPNVELDPESDREKWKHREAIVSHLRKAATLVICVDSTDPHLEEFAIGFPQLLGKALKGGTGRLYANRVLLLLTKVDVLADRFLADARASYEQLRETEHPTVALEVLGRNREIKSRTLAAALDPVEMARALLGQATLSMIRRALRDNAQMAVGVCSATGFYPDGTSFWVAGEKGGPRVRPGEDENDAYRNWCPFGIHEAIRYLVTGRRGSTIGNYTWRDDLYASKRQSYRVKLATAGRPFAPAREGD